jgi:hypothetical protein
MRDSLLYSTIKWCKNNLHITKPYYRCNSRAKENTKKIVVTQDHHLQSKGDTTCISATQMVMVL